MSTEAERVLQFQTLGHTEALQYQLALAGLCMSTVGTKTCNWKPVTELFSHLSNLHFLR